MTTTTTTHTRDAIAHFQSLAQQSLDANGSGARAWHALRRKAVGQLGDMRFPTRRDEDWKYTSVSAITNEPWALGRAVPVKAEDLSRAFFDGLDALRIVFVNGVWQPELSTSFDDLPEGLSIAPMSRLLEREPDGWAAQTLEAQAAHDHVFAVLNAALAHDGLVVQVAPNAVIEQPLHFIFIAADQGEAFVQAPQLYVHAARGSKLTFVEHYLPQGGGAPRYFTCAATRVRVDANAEVHHYRLQREGRFGRQVNHCAVEQERDSRYYSYATDLGGMLVRNNHDVALRDSNTQTYLNGVYLLGDEQHADNQTFMDHAVPHCESNELYKGIVTGKARGVFNGKVLVRPDAQKTNAFQQNSTLLLSPQAVMDAKPQLEIFADDVRCSHGATIGQLDETSVFYLRTRGLSAKEARRLLQFAFLAEVLDNMPDEPVREAVKQLVHDKLYEIG